MRSREEKGKYQKIEVQKTSLIWNIPKKKKKKSNKGGERGSVSHGLQRCSGGKRKEITKRRGRGTVTTWKSISGKSIKP